MLGIIKTHFIFPSNIYKMCTSYRMHWIEFALPSPYIFDELCVSYDKTTMFINTFFKIIVYLTLSAMIQRYFKETELTTIIFYILMTIVYINSLAIFIILIKKPKYSETNIIS